MVHYDVWSVLFLILKNIVIVRITFVCLDKFLMKMLDLKLFALLQKIWTLYGSMKTRAFSLNNHMLKL